ncbi:MAG TPA: NAD(P)-dependent oxidoreductase, partial [Clostridiales bacterium]|nr:NAD(P)-dependent oxidoreductase [Clostridiales bacterium]
TKKNLKIAQSMPKGVKIIWGNLKTGENLELAIKDQDVVIHLAFIIPPASERNPELAYEINVGGTRTIVEIIKSQKNPPKLIFTSTIAVFGNSQSLTPPRRVGDPLNPVDNYGKQKIECEGIVKSSGLKWSILRLAAAPSIDWQRVDPIMYDVPLTDRIEFVHPGDVGCALANAAGSKEIWGKILLIGGGPNCQMYQREFMKKALGMLGIGMLPDEAFGKEPYHTDWMDTDESQRLLNYQGYSYDDFLKEQAKLFGKRAFFIKLLRPIVRWYLLCQSPYYQEFMSGKVKSKRAGKCKICRKVALASADATARQIPKKKNNYKYKGNGSGRIKAHKMWRRKN